MVISVGICDVGSMLGISERWLGRSRGLSWHIWGHVGNGRGRGLLRLWGSILARASFCRSVTTFPRTVILIRGVLGGH